MLKSSTSGALALLCGLMGPGWESPERGPQTVQADPAPPAVDLLPFLKKALGHDFRVVQTPHFLLVCDTEDKFTQDRGRQLEAVYTSWIGELDFPGVSPQEPPDRMVVLLFVKRADFQRYARLADGQELPLFGGYYSQRTNVAAFYDEASGGASVELEQALAGATAQVQRVSRLIKDPKGSQEYFRATGLLPIQAQDRLLRQIGSVRATYEARAILSNAAKIQHEAAHLLAFNTGLQAREVDYPAWLSEGLASQFEAQDTQLPSASLRWNPDYGPAITSALGGRDLVPLEVFLFREQPQDLGAKPLFTWYAQSWALFKFLYLEHRTGLGRLLEAYRREAPRRPIPPERHRQLFQEAFGGDPGGVEKGFLWHLQNQPAR
jgi:hypothetical protein